MPYQLYLSGIETSEPVVQLSTFPPINCTYLELKQEGYDVTTDPKFIYQLYLSGIETLRGWLLPWLGLRYQLYLSGIETWVKDLCEDLEVDYQLYQSGIETILIMSDRIGKVSINCTYLELKLYYY